MQSTFFDKCLARLENPDAIGSYIRMWHELPEDGVELHDFLGMTWDEYTSWGEGSKTILSILNARKTKETLD